MIIMQVRNFIKSNDHAYLIMLIIVFILNFVKFNTQKTLKYYNTHF